METYFQYIRTLQKFKLLSDVHIIDVIDKKTIIDIIDDILLYEGQLTMEYENLINLEKIKDDEDYIYLFIEIFKYIEILATKQNTLVINILNLNNVSIKQMNPTLKHDIKKLSNDLKISIHKYVKKSNICFKKFKEERESMSDPLCDSIKMKQIINIQQQLVLLNLNSI